MDTHSCNNLCEAVFEDHVECIKKLIIAGADPNTTDYKGEKTPLHEAARRGRDACVRVLVAAGADVNAGSRTPLHAAVINGHDACVRMLLSAGADPNVTDNAGITPLHYAIFRGNAVWELIAAGADVNAGSWTPLHSAAHEGSEVFVQMLVAAGSNPNAVDDEGRTPLQLAVDRGHVECAKICKRYNVQILTGISTTYKI
jgi:ankyrin repeat protein